MSFSSGLLSIPSSPTQIDTRSCPYPRAGPCAPVWKEVPTPVYLPSPGECNCGSQRICFDHPPVFCKILAIQESHRFWATRKGTHSPNSPSIFNSTSFLLFSLLRGTRGNPKSISHTCRRGCAKETADGQGCEWWGSRDWLQRGRPWAPRVEATAPRDIRNQISHGTLEISL